jgi:tellurite resistance protein
MSIIRSLARPVALSLALAIGAVPLTAFAQDPATPAQHQGKGKGKGRHEKGDRDAHFPMKAEAFKQHVEKRIGRALAKVNAMIEKKKVPEIIAGSIRKDADAAATQVRAAAAKAAADGTVTKEEAKVVRDLANQLKKEARAKYGQQDKQAKR